jgi:hypothetical protein
MERHTRARARSANVCVRLHLEAPSFLSASKEKERPECARGVRVLFRFNSKFRRVLNLFTYVNKKAFYGISRLTRW